MNTLETKIILEATPNELYLIRGLIYQSVTSKVQEVCDAFKDKPTEPDWRANFSKSYKGELSLLRDVCSALNTMNFFSSTLEELCAITNGIVFEFN